MSKNPDIIQDIADMHKKFSVHEVVEGMSHERLLDFVNFRVGCLDEELNETIEAVTAAEPEEVVDGLIDLTVFAIGTLDALGVDVGKAWKTVHDKNMQKVAGHNANRPNEFGFPDLIKPDGWTPPNHEDNVGKVEYALNS